MRQSVIVVSVIILTLLFITFFYFFKFYFLMTINLYFSEETYLILLKDLVMVINKIMLSNKINFCQLK